MSYLQNYKEFEAEILDLQLEKYALSFDTKKCTTSGLALGDENVIGIRSFNYIVIFEKSCNSSTLLMELFMICGQKHTNKSITINADDLTKDIYQLIISRIWDFIECTWYFASLYHFVILAYSVFYLRYYKSRIQWLTCRWTRKAIK